ncbi:amidohydrolase family protein [Solidesulfovibrio magneticus]|uniref:Amidohydrolase-related domain-containing protein n=1 Tax=Solidesulfovibrio magneticus (strain ATCC 700980 / DSM 13731 / RS-1) TaxID=573370 RepID=C4XTF7_SOLM1|nr:amidohydrolase family protein [Solidesulfovibrio magneticus]BAH75954.1 hypothetical protein DMR_24630 [Solidesulfovibrio magneticus RS-1]
MNIFDCNIHFSLLGAVDRPHLTSDETRMGPADLEACFDVQGAAIQAAVRAANFMLFNQELFFGDGLDGFMGRVRRALPGSTFTALIDFRRQDAPNAVALAAAQGVRGLKFHSYFQRIAEEDFPAALAVARRAQDLGLFVCVDTSYGTSGMYRYDNLRLACLLAEMLTVPIILLHSGGLRVFEAMLLAEDHDHVYLETSFSPHYYQGSTVEDNFRWAYRKLGAHKLLYGSDHPYLGLEQSQRHMRLFLEHCRFSPTDIAAVFHDNAHILFA